MAHGDGSKESLLDQDAQYAAKPHKLFKDSQTKTKTRATILKKCIVLLTDHHNGEIDWNRYF